MTVNQQEENPPIHAGNQAIKIIKHFNFLRSVTSNQCGISIGRRSRLQWQNMHVCYEQDVEGQKYYHKNKDQVCFHLFKLQ